MRKRSSEVEQARQTLLKIRQRRIEALDEYCKGILEKEPYHPICSWNGSKLINCTPDDLKQIKFFELIIDPPDSENDYQKVIRGAKALEKKTADELLMAWINEGGNERTSRSRTSFRERLKRSSLWRDLKTKSTAREVLLKIWGNNQAANWIHSLQEPLGSKQAYKDQLVSFLRFALQGLLPFFSLFPFTCPIIFPQETAAVLNFLEEQALNSRTLKKYADLLLVRAIIYTKLPTQVLLTLPKPSEEELFLTSGSVRFLVTRSFVDLWKNVHGGDDLLPSYLKKMPNANQALNTKFKRIGKRIGLRISVTPKILKCALADLYSTKLIVPVIVPHAIIHPSMRNSCNLLSKKIPPADKRLKLLKSSFLIRRMLKGWQDPTDLSIVHQS